MKRVIVMLVALMGFSAVSALTSAQVLTYVEADMEKKEITLTRSLPDALSNAYSREMRKIYAAIADAYHNGEDTKMTTEELRTLISPFYISYKALQKDRENYDKTKTSQYLITDADKKRVTDEVLVYQTRIVSFMEEALNAAYKNYREEGRFVFTVKNTLVDVTIQSPKIISKVNIDQNRTATEIQLEFDATIKDPKTVKISGSLNFEMITEADMLYLRVSDLNITTSGDAETKQSIDDMVAEAQKMLEKIGKKYIAIPVEDADQLTTITEIRKKLDAWKKYPILVPYKRVTADKFALDINYDNFAELGLPEEENITANDETIEIQFANNGSQVGICPAEGFGKMGAQDTADKLDLCVYAKRSGNSAIQWKIYAHEPGQNLVDIMINEFGSDFRSHIIADGMDASVNWSYGKINGTVKDGTDTYTVNGELSTKNANLNFKKNNITAGNLSWNMSDTASSIKWDLQLWDDYSTYLTGEASGTRTYETNSITIPTNTISADEVNPYSYDDVTYPEYEDYSDDYSYSGNISGTLSAKDTQQLLLKNHVKQFGQSNVALVVFTDIECPYCQRFATTLSEELPDLTDYELHIKHFPLEFHPNAKAWAIEAECVAKKYGDELFFSYLDERMVVGVTGDYLAGNFDITAADLAACKKSGSIANIIQRDAVFAEKYNIYGTPSTIVINKKTGAYEMLSGALPVESILAAIQRVQ